MCETRMPKIAYLFLVYKNADFVYHTCKMLEGKDTYFYIHVDSGSKESFKELENNPHVKLAKERYKCEWGKGGIVYAIMSSIKTILSLWDTEYIILMSESDYPVKSPDYIKSYLRKQDCDFCSFQKLPHNKWLEGGYRRVHCYALHYGNKQAATIEPKVLNWGNIRQFGKLLLQSPASIPKAIKMLFYPPRQKPTGLEWCGGDLWFTIKGETAKLMVDYVQRDPQILKESDLGICMDEVTIPTLIEAFSKKRINSILRYVNWPKTQSNSPLFFNDTAEDRAIIKDCISNPDILFIRKVDNELLQEYIDSNIEM